MARKAELKAVLKLDNIQFARTIRHSIQMAKDLAKQFARQPIRTSFLAGIFSARGAVQLAGKAVETFGRITASVFRSVTTGSLLLKAAVVAAFGFFLHKVIEASAAAEDYRTVFGVLLGSAEKASKRMKELLNFANARGLRLTTVAEASRTLETLTRGALSTGKGLEMVGNIAAGTNTQFEDMAVTVGRLFDAMRTGQGGGESLMRLQDLGAITGQQRRRISALGQAKFGAEGWREAQAALSKFDGMMTARSTNWNMRMEKFRDSIEEAMRQFGTPLMESLKPALSALTDVIFNIAPKLSVAGKEFGETITKAVGFLTETFSDPKKLVGAFKDGLFIVFSTAVEFLIGGFKIAVSFLSDGMMSGAVALVEYLGAALLDVFSTPVARMRAQLEAVIESLKESAGFVNPKNWISNTKGLFNAGVARMKGDKEAFGKFFASKATNPETIASRTRRYLEIGQGQSSSLKAAGGKHLADSIDGLIRAFKETKIPEAVRTMAAKITEVIKEISKKKETDPADEIRKRMTDQAMIIRNRGLRTGGLRTIGLQSTGGGLEPFPHSRTPLIRYHERRAFDMAQRAGVQGILGHREEGDTKIRRGDRKRMQEAQRERLREKMGLDKTNAILESIQKSFDSLIK